MVSNQPPPFPAFGGTPGVAGDPDEQVIVDVSDEQGVSGAPLDDAFANLTPEHVEE